MDTLLEHLVSAMYSQPERLPQVFSLNPQELFNGYFSSNQILKHLDESLALLTVANSFGAPAQAPLLLRSSRASTEF